MKPTSFLSIIVLCGALLATGRAQESHGIDDRVQGWRGDIEFLQGAVAREHFLYKTKPLPESFQQRATELKGSVASMSDKRILVEFQRLMATLGDGHCYVSPSPKFIQRLTSPPEELPVRLHCFSDGLFVIDGIPGHESWIGRRLTQLGSISADDALRQVVDYIPKDNLHGARWRGPMFLGYRSFLEAIGSIGTEPGAITLGFAGVEGAESREVVTFVPMRVADRATLVPSRQPGAPEIPLHLRHLARNYWFEPIPQHEALYLQFNSVQDSPDETLKSFAARLEAGLGKLRPRLLVVDVRYNGGGNADLLDPLVRALQQFEQATPAGKLVVLIGPHTFSAAQIFISRLDRVTKAVFAGEPSGSKPNFVGEHNPVELPWSGLIANISNRRHEIIPGDTREWIEPELKMALSSRDYFANRDPVLEAVFARYAESEKRGN